jgi:phosphatidylserine decarboxylase
VCRQVVGILARRIVCRVQAGADLRAGQRFGVMKFGSRIDLYLPPDSIVRVAVGDRVQSGVTVLATLPPARPIS